MKKIIILFSLLFSFLSFSSFATESFEDNIINFYNLKKQGYYISAFFSLANAVKLAETNNEKIISLFRLREICDLPELREKILDLLNDKFINEKYDDLFCKNFLYTLKSAMYADSFNFDKAKKMSKLCGYVFNMQMFKEPIKNCSIENFEKIDPQKYLLDNEKFCQFFATADGTFDLTSCSKPNDAFLLRSNFFTDGEKDVTFFLGTSSRFSLYVDGCEIIKNADNRNFFSLQTKVVVKVSAGKHEVVIKVLTNEKNDNKFSVIICNADDEKQKTSGKILSFNVKPFAFSWAKNDNLYHLGYCLMSSGFLYGEKNAQQYLSSINVEDNFYSEAKYFLGKLSTNDEDASVLYNDALFADKNNMEAALSFLGICYKYNRLNEAANALQKMISCPLKNIAFVRYCIKKKWHNDALRVCERIISDEIESYGIRLKAQVMFSNNNYGEAYNLAKNAFMKRRSFSVATFMTRCVAPKDAECLYKFLVSSFSENFAFKLKLAKALHFSNKSDEFNTVLLSIKKGAPFLGEIDNLYSDFYFKRGNTQLARFYAINAWQKESANKEYERKKNFFAKMQNDEVYNFKKEIANCEKYKNENAVVFYDINDNEIFFDGSFLEKRKKAILVNSVEKAENLKLQYVVIDALNDKINSIKALIIRDGKVVSNLHFTRQNLSDVQSRLYYNYESVSATLNNLTDGDVIVFEYEILHKRSDNGVVGIKKYFDNTYRLLSGKYKLTTDKKVQLYFKTENCNEKVHLKTSANKKEYFFEIKNIAPIKQETLTQPYNYLCAGVMFSSFSSWDVFYKWYKDLLKDRVFLTNEMKEIARSLTEGKSDVEKIRAIYKHITDKTRYVGFELGIGSFQPRKTDVVFNSSLGDCKDVALLLAAMLRFCGFDASIALVKTASKGKSSFDFVSVGNFNHAICFVNFDGPLFLDGTVRSRDIYELPETDCDIDALVIDEKKWHIVKTGRKRYIESCDSVKNIILIDENGNANIERTLIKTGDFACGSRDSFLLMDKKNDDTQKYWSNIFPSAKVLPIFLKCKDAGKPLEYLYKVNIDNFVKFSNKISVVPCFFQKDLYLAQVIASKKRENNLFIKENFVGKTENIFLLPHGFNVISKDCSFSKEYKGNKFEIILKNDFYEGQKCVVVKSNFVLQRNVYLQDEYLIFRDFVIDYIKAQNLKIVVEKNDER